MSGLRHCICAVACVWLASPSLEIARAQALRFDQDVAPILRDHCIKCHGAEARKGGLDLRTVVSMTQGGDAGEAIVPGKSGESLVIEQVVSGKMPPGKNPKLTGEEIAVLKRWIDSGAHGKTGETKPVASSFWAFQSPKRPRVPAVRKAEQARNAVDRFLLAKLETNGLTFSPEANPATLVRRVYFDLWGLPPSPEETSAFLTDKRPDAWERLVDSLIASPHYGERWGRHWLDLAGYADSEGILDADYERSCAWRYRDFVIRAFNADLPYDRFLELQIAGDELIDYPSVYRTQKHLNPDQVEALVATGYLRCASDTSRPDFKQIKNAPGYYYQTLEDTLKIVASSTLGLTLQCAKCHSHKYDPITQEEYYRVQAIFMSGYRPAQWVPQVERRLFESTAAQDAEAKAYNARLDASVADLTKKAQALKETFAARLLADRLAQLPEPIREDTRNALATEPAKQTEVQKYLTAKFADRLKPPEPKLSAALATLYPDYKTQAADITSKIAEAQARRRTFPEIRAFYDLPGEPKTPILKRGDYTQPGREVRPGVLRALGTPEPFAWSSPAKDAKTSGRRLAFAKWLTQPGHPLTSRVMVNRIWLLHFGEGLVATPDNFGTAGAAPSHRELLDWLACDLVARGWSIKAMHRLILTSTAYRQSSRFDPRSPAHARAKQVDPGVRLLWRQRMRRLEAEPLRDAMLAAGGLLNTRMFGSPVPFVIRPDGEVVAPEDPSGRRRSIYLKVRRSQPLTLLQSFDQPVMETNCPRRGVSTIASQALNLLNGDTLTSIARAFAARLERETRSDQPGRAVQLALGRLTSDAERAALESFLAAQSSRHARSTGGAKPDLGRARQRALEDLCQMLLSSNEFAYVD
jgi:Protein of unknown function (DUF1553)/Protein of unknown function (DUF1549)/Planctomycete cytochrome C